MCFGVGKATLRAHLQPILQSLLGEDISWNTRRDSGIRLSGGLVLPRAPFCNPHSSPSPESPGHQPPSERAVAADSASPTSRGTPASGQPRPHQRPAPAWRHLGCLQPRDPAPHKPGTCWTPQAAMSENGPLTATSRAGHSTCAQAGWTQDPALPAPGLALTQDLAGVFQEAVFPDTGPTTKTMHLGRLICNGGGHCIQWRK